jgi:hypothetical protein
MKKRIRIDRRKISGGCKPYIVTEMSENYLSYFKKYTILRNAVGPI